jgi:hypothetical protein
LKTNQKCATNLTTLLHLERFNPVSCENGELAKKEKPTSYLAT